MSKGKLTKEEQKELERLLKEILEEAKFVVEDYSRITRVIEVFKNIERISGAGLLTHTPHPNFVN